jgi:cupin superfamily acireductone dioxygenase involved in methionine salvage
MKNIEHIKENYELSTITLLMEKYGYETEDNINIDPDITDVLTFLKKEGLETQHALFTLLDHLHDELGEVELKLDDLK